jgi:hypothetical protein
MMTSTERLKLARQRASRPRSLVHAGNKSWTTTCTTAYP